MNNLKEFTVQEICTIVTKGTTPTTYGKAFTSDGVNFIKAEALNGDSDLDTNGFCFIDEETHESILKRSRLQVDDILLTIAGVNIGKCGYVKPEHLPANTNQAVAIVRVNPLKAKPIFIYYVFKNQRMFKYIQGLNAQAAQPNLNLTLLKSIKIQLPSLKIQNKIADILSSYDEAIANNRRRIELLERSARLLYKEWFVHLRFPGHEHVAIGSDGIPHGWERVPLEKICFDKRESVHPNDLPADTPYIGLEHIPRRSITLSQWDTSEKVTSQKFKFSESDILFGKIRPYFHKVGFALTNGIASSDMIVIRVHHHHYYCYCLMLVSSDDFVRLASQTMREGSKMPRADWKLLLKTEFLMPPRTILMMFNNYIQPTLNLLKDLAFQNQKLQQARDLLLPRLMNGEITV